MNPILVAIDTPDYGAAEALADRVQPHVGGVKLGLEFFTANGPERVGRIARRQRVFLDLKFHDIPNTVAGAVRAAADLGAFMLTLHAGGGPAMLAAAVKAAGDRPDRPKLVGVTVLTSLDDADLARVGQQPPAADQVVRLARLCQDSGLDGVVCSPREIAAVRAACGADFTLVVPGIRPEGADTGDQKRTLTPAEARAAGADWLVIGRPITAADDPAAAAKAIAGSLA